MSKHHSHTDRSHGGPGSSHQDERGANPTHQNTSEPGQNKIGGMRNPEHSAISGGGGERDAHHTHDPDHNRRRKSA